MLNLIWQNLCSFMGITQSSILCIPIVYTFHFPTQICSDSFDNHQIYELDQAADILKHPRFDPTKETTLYIHGYIETPEVESIHVIVDAYQKNGDQNIIILDWGDLADGNYLLDAVQNAKQVG